MRMSSPAVWRRAVRATVGTLAAAAGLACGPEGATAPFSSYPCQVGWKLTLVARDPLQDYYYESLDDARPFGGQGAVQVEVGDSIEVALTRMDMTLDASGDRCVSVETVVSSPWTLTAADPIGSLSITQPHGTAPAVVRALTAGPVRVRAILGRDTIDRAWLTVMPRIASLVITPSDTVDAGAVPVSVRIAGLDSLGQPVQVSVYKTRWAVLGTSTIPVALWPSVSTATRSNDPSIDATVTFPTTATVGTALIRFRTRHASATLSVTVPPAP